MSKEKLYGQLDSEQQMIAEVVAALPTESGGFTREDHYEGSERVEAVARVVMKGCRSQIYPPGCLDCLLFNSGRKICDDVAKGAKRVEAEARAKKRYELIGEESPGVFGADDVRRMAEQGLLVVSIAFGQAVYREIPKETEV